MCLAPTELLPNGPSPLPAAVAGRLLLRPGRGRSGGPDRPGTPGATGDRTALELRRGAELHHHVRGNSSGSRPSTFFSHLFTFHLSFAFFFMWV